MNDWKPGARAVIMVSEWPANRGRVVTLKEVLPREFWRHEPVAPMLPVWLVSDGHMFDAYSVDASANWTGDVIKTIDLGIGQWKLRLLDDNEPVYEDVSTGIEYAVT